MRTYMSRLSHLKEEDLLNKGQYRSLRRRLANLLHWDIRTVDLSKIDKGQEGRLWLVRAYAALDRTAFPRIGQHTRPIRIIHDKLCPKWSASLFDGVEQQGLQHMWSNWETLKSKSRISWWPRLLVYLLDCKPGRALRFMQLLANDPLVKSELDIAMLADGLGHLSRLHKRGQYEIRQGWDADPEVNKQSFMPAFHYIFSQKLTDTPEICSQDLLHNIASFGRVDDIKKNFDLLAEHRTFMVYDTLLHFANAFGEAGELQYALRSLDQLEQRYHSAAWRVVVERKRLRWTCALILRKSMQQAKSYHETPEIVETFVDMGIKMDTLLYNIVIQNAMEAGDYSTAFKVYNALEGNGLKPDKYTYSILLHGCTLQDNPAMFSEFADHCSVVAKELQDSWLATDYLYYLSIRHQDSADNEYTSSLLWRAYLEHFSAAPLKSLINHSRPKLRNAIEAQDVSADSVLMSPTSMALYLMLQVEIKSAQLVGNQRVMNLYQHFKLLVSEESNLNLHKLAQQPIIWNTFLLAFCKQQQFADAGQVIKTMTKSGPQPNIYTWNIFMQAFFKTGQVQAAGRVFDIIRDKGIKADQYTYGILMRGYAKAQLVERIGDSMQHVDEEQEMDPDLLRALATVVNREQLMNTMEKSRAEKKSNAQLYATKQAASEKKRWAIPRFSPDLLEDSSTAAMTDDSVSRQNPSIPQQAFERTKLTSLPGEEYGGIFPFLEAPLSAADAAEPPTSTYSQSSKINTPLTSPSTYNTSDSHNTNTQSRTLEQDLRITSPKANPTLVQHPYLVSSNTAAHPPSTPPTSNTAPGVNLGFTSMLSTTPSQGQTSTPVARRRQMVKAQSISPQKPLAPKEKPRSGLSRDAHRGLGTTIRRL
jgi:pentatricopeptide repeat protein